MLWYQLSTCLLKLIITKSWLMYNSVTYTLLATFVLFSDTLYTVLFVDLFQCAIPVNMEKCAAL